MQKLFKFLLIVFFTLALHVSVDAGDSVLLSPPESGHRTQDTTLIKGFAFTGNTIVDSQKLHELTASYVNKELSFDEMLAVTKRIEKYYIDSGYLLTLAYLPPQEIKDGILHITVLEQKLGEISVEGNTYYDDRVFKRYFKGLQKRSLHESPMSRSVLLARELPAVDNVDLSLKAGKKRGEVDGVVTVKNRLPVKWNLSYNNLGPELTSKNTYGTNIEISEPFWGSTLSLRGITGDSFDNSGLGYAQYTLPLNGYGTTLTASYLKGLYHAGQELEPLNLEGDTEVYGGELRHPLLTDDRKKFDLFAGYHHKYVKQEIFNQTSGNDRLNVYHLGFDFDYTDNYLGKNILSGAVFQGDYQREDGSPFFSPLTLRTDQDFTRFTLDAARIQKIPTALKPIFILRGHAQYTEERLAPTERTVLGGYGSVRGHEASQFLGDSGYTLSGELMLAPFESLHQKVMGQNLGQMVQLAFFYDHGGVFTSNVEPGEYNSQYLSGGGCGIRLFYKEVLSCKFDVAFPVEKTAVDDDVYYYFLVNLNPLKFSDLF